MIRGKTHQEYATSLSHPYTTFEINSLLDRPTQIRRAANTSFENQTTFAYDDTLRMITTFSDRDANNDNLLVSKVLYDKMGRTIETRQYEGGTNYIATQRQYDALGRAYKTSNPFRASESILWTTTLFDALGRVTTITTPDNAVVTTEYRGDLVLVSDQQSKKRMSRANALSQLKDVWEITPNDPTQYPGIQSFSFGTQTLHGYLTHYDYDALDDLVTITQGSQQRSFIYDSLKRLTSAINPESGTISYQYDGSGNLIVKTDARLVSTHFAYDALNRLTRRWYNGSNSLTATTHNSPALPSGVGTSDEANLYYDSQSLPSGAPSFSRGPSTGRLVAATYGTSGSAGDYFGYDAAGRTILKIQQTGSVNYHVTSEYNLAGGITSLKYPAGHVVSGHKVSYAYDVAGRVESFTGSLGDGITRNYSTEILYAPQGAVAKEKFGMTTPIYNKLFYNSRGQLAEIRDGLNPTDGSWERGAIINHYSSQCWGACSPTSTMTDNNGNLRQQDHWVPNSSGGVQAIYVQNYEYDSLNRLKRVSESTNWQQEYVYDRWGNRTLSATGTWLGSPNNPPDPILNEKQFETANLPSTNRLYAPGDLAPSLPENERKMRYDAAGNLIKDTYTISGGGERVYDVENRMTKAWGGNNQWQEYTYDAEGHRVRRKIDGLETWQVYGFDGELLAEYTANAAAASPQKEYGYRNGQMLITAEAVTPQYPPLGSNLAAASSGAVATASSSYPTITPANAINGDHIGTASHWADDTSNAYPDWLQVQFAGSKMLNEIDVFGLQQGSAVEPTLTMTSSYALTNFEVQYWTGSAWVVVPGGTVTGNDKVWRRFTFPTVSTTKIRVHVTNVAGDNHSQIVEIEAYGPTNVALAANGAVASASSTFPTVVPANAINGDHIGTASHWADDTSYGYPDWLQVDFAGTKTIGEIDVFGLQQGTPVEPSLTMTSSYALTSFEVQYWTGSAWAVIPGGSVTGNDKVWRKFTFAPLSTTKIRVYVTNVIGDNHSQVVEIEAWTPGSSANLNWLVTDQLGTPRIILDQSGSLANTKRHDYLPFGEELFAGVGGRTTGQGYGTGDGVRQKFTSKERDNETGLDYFLARYYSSTQGRFTSPDEFKDGPVELFVRTGDSKKQAIPYAEIAQPQSLNKYAYVYNNPCRYNDPDGHCGTPSGLKPGQAVICVASFIKTKWFPPGVGPGRGDGRGPNGQGGTSRLEVRVVVDTAKGTVTKTDETMARSGIVSKGVGLQGSGGSQVSEPTKDKQGNVYFQISQHGDSAMNVGGMFGTIDNHLNLVVTPDNKVGITPSSTAKDYPSLEVFRYTVDAKGNVTTTQVHVKHETAFGALKRKEQPIKEDPK